MRMLLRKWNDIPECMRNEEVKKYYDMLSNKKGKLILKRIFDIVMSLFLIVILSPVFLVLSIWIKLDSKGRIFYCQERITQYGKVFRILKFRTMVCGADQIGELLTTQNDVRITKVGAKIRKCRLDEIPQLFNVLIGDMSFVGTRPEVKKYVDAYSEEMKATLLMPAGITSLASIHYKNEDEILSSQLDRENNLDMVYINEVLPEKMKYNLEYMVKFTLFVDITICVKTVF